MSGPKVVRIVTREEILAICEGHLRRLDQAIADWAGAGRRGGMLTDAEIAGTQARRDALAALVAADAFMELQKRVPEEIIFLKADLARRQQAAVEGAARKAQRQRQGRHGARTLLDAADQKGIEIPAALRGQLDRLSAGQMLDDADAVLAQGFALLRAGAGAVADDARTLSASQQALAKRLQTADAVSTLDAWKAAQQAQERDPALARLDRGIGEASVFLDAADVAGFTSRIAAIDMEQAGPRRSLLLDSLILDLSAAVAAGRARHAALATLRELAADLGAYRSADAAAFVEQVAQYGEATSAESIAASQAAGNELIVRLRQQQAEAARRTAILNGLAKLGYEVNEGMATAWASGGRVVVKKPSLPGYGVEVGGQVQTGRLQVRAVSLTANRDVSRDKDVETLWCGDFGRLQDLLAQHGDDLLIERSMGVGEVPLKVVADMADTVSVQAAGRTLG
ncbi:hypothetical protein [Bordetella sp. N]|uniref:hypothetical protein n=1 Tax=Bordetella sp. N TaxID=1746199 RepID=UPI00070C3B8C|nr:hypothetical protein [Bordetella sp. N]ALM83939.1 hypothetical protein ASB57_14020 [Bordetella sp. N]